MPPLRPTLPEPTLTVEDLVAIYNVNKRTIWRWVRQGRLPRPLAVTNRVSRWRTSEIQKHLDDLPKKD